MTSDGAHLALPLSAPPKKGKSAAASDPKETFGKAGKTNPADAGSVQMIVKRVCTFPSFFGIIAQTL